MKIIQMTKLFCLHFDKVNEEPRPECLVDSGCKMVDIIDSARFIEKKICWEYCSKEYFNAKVLLNEGYSVLAKILNQYEGQ